VPHPSRSAEIGADIVERLRTGDARALEALFRPVVREALPIRRAIPRRSRGGGGSGPGPLRCPVGRASCWTSASAMRAFSSTLADCAPTSESTRGGHGTSTRAADAFPCAERSITCSTAWTRAGCGRSSRCAGEACWWWRGERTQWPRLPLAGLSWEFLIRRKRPGQWGLR